jgi:hypothetical protein
MLRGTLPTRSTWYPRRKVVKNCNLFPVSKQPRLAKRLHGRLDRPLDLRYKLLPQCAKRIATR